MATERAWPWRIAFEQASLAMASRCSATAASWTGRSTDSSMSTCGRTPGVSRDALCQAEETGGQAARLGATRSEPAEGPTGVLYRAGELAPDLMHSGAQLLEVRVWLSVAVLPPHQS